MKKTLFGFAAGGTLGSIGTILGLLYTFLKFLEKCPPAKAAIKDLTTDMITSGLETMIYGETYLARRRRTQGINYSRYGSRTRA